MPVYSKPLLLAAGALVTLTAPSAAVDSLRGMGGQHSNIQLKTAALVEKTPFTTYPIASKNYDDCKQFCQSMGQELLSKNELMGSMGKTGGDVWTPVRGAMGNDWLQVGGDGSWKFGELHDEILNGIVGKPSWGNTKTTMGFKKSFYCTATENSRSQQITSTAAPQITSTASGGTYTSWKPELYQQYTMRRVSERVIAAEEARVAEDRRSCERGKRLRRGRNQPRETRRYVLRLLRRCGYI